VLTTLAGKSLVVYEEQRGEARYRLLETVRQYAGDRLQESGYGATYRRRHRDHFLGLAEEVQENLNGPEQGPGLYRLETEHDNLRQALTFCLEEAEGGETGLRLGAALQPFWSTRGHLSEGRERLLALLAGSKAREHTKARAAALSAAAYLAELQGDYASARSLQEESMKIRRELGDRQGIAQSLNNLGNVAYRQGDYASACSLQEEALIINRQLGNRSWVSNNLNNLGNVAYNRGDYASARSLYEESLEIQRELGDRWGIADTVLNLGNVAYSQGDYASARSLHEESLALKRELGDKRGSAMSLNNLGHVAHSQGDYASARPLLEESLLIRRELGDRPGIAYTLESFASLNAKEDNREQAARLWGAAERLREEIGTPLAIDDRDEQDRDVTAVRLVMSQEAFSTSWAEGRAMTMQQAIEHALD
jgi:tetratricopeptide (TPR) repeat protein